SALRTLVEPIYFEDATRAFRGAPVVVGSSGILVDIDRNIVLWAGYEHVRRAPASTAKMMTSIVVLENFPLDQQITVSPAAAGRDVVETRMGLLPNEKLTVRELLSGMLTVSANDAADAVADGTVGMDAFVDAMNRQVTALGLSDTHFTNPVGFPDDPQETSSAYDLAAIATAAYRNYPLFRELTATHDVFLPASGIHQEYRLHNINRLLDIYPAAIGTKSGFTDDAGPCLVSMAARNGHHLVAVLMNAHHMFDQTRTLMEWGFTQEGLPAMYPAPPPATPAPPRR
ncbi:MAG TPA: serine hydrolase, partial [Candidatus Dormibacteraeota bacterium]|nr:serine hydrolase [Candidatus Dormibacteraeota bacterium]